MDLCSREWFIERLIGLRCSAEAGAYVVGVVNKFVVSVDGDMSDVSLVVSFDNASRVGDFVELQRLGDWVLWSMAIVPESVADRVKLTEMIGREAYDACYRLLRRQLYVYKELSVDLSDIAKQVNRRLLRQGEKR